MSYDEYPPENHSYGSYSNASYEEDLSTSLAAEDNRPRILLMGTRRSGKSSIQKVVFHKMSPHETLFLESTNDIRLRDISTSALVQFQLLDFPGNFDFSSSGIDHRSSVGGGGGGGGVPGSVSQGGRVLGGGGGGPGKKSSGGGHGVTADRVFKKPGALVFVIDAQDDENQFSESIDYFIQMAKIAYKINPKLSFDVLIHKVDGDAYLSDDHKMECQNEIKKSISEELIDCGLPIRPSFHLTSIYDHSIFEAFSKIVQSLIPQLPLLEKLLDGLIGSCGMEKSFLFDIVSKIYVATDSNPVDMQTYELCSDMIDVVIDVSCIYGLKASNAAGADGGAEENKDAEKPPEQLAYDANSAAVIKLSNNYILYLREVNKYLALVCLMRAECWQASGLVEFNFSCYKEAITQLLEVKNKMNKKPTAAGAGGAPTAAASSQQQK